MRLGNLNKSKTHNIEILIYLTEKKLRIVLFDLQKIVGFVLFKNNGQIKTLLIDNNS